jgi:hypothetical protein
MDTSPHDIEAHTDGRAGVPHIILSNIEALARRQAWEEFRPWSPARQKPRQGAFFVLAECRKAL